MSGRTVEQYEGSRLLSLSKPLRLRSWVSAPLIQHRSVPNSHSSRRDFGAGLPDMEIYLAV